MPQLMPLNWGTSGTLLMFFLLTGCFIYSELSLVLFIMKDTNIEKNSLMSWCW